MAAMVAATWEERETIEENLCPRLARLDFRSEPDLIDCCLSRIEAMSSFFFDSFIKEFLLSRLFWLTTLPARPSSVYLKIQDVVCVVITNDIKESVQKQDKKARPIVVALKLSLYQTFLVSTFSAPINSKYTSNLGPENT